MRVKGWTKSVMTGRFLAHGTRQMKVSSAETENTGRGPCLVEGDERQREREEFFLGSISLEISGTHLSRDVKLAARCIGLDLKT